MTVRINGILTDEEVAALDKETPDTVTHPYRVEVSVKYPDKLAWTEVAICKTAAEGVECLAWHRANVLPDYPGQLTRLVFLASDYA